MLLLYLNYNCYTQLSFQKDFRRLLVHPLQLCFLFHPHAIKPGRQIQKTFTLIPNSVKPFLFTIASSNIRVCSYSSTSFWMMTQQQKVRQTGWDDHHKCPCKTLRLFNSEVAIYITNRLWKKKLRFCFSTLHMLLLMFVCYSNFMLLSLQLGFKTSPQPVQSPPSNTSINAGYL